MLLLPSRSLPCCPHVLPSCPPQDCFERGHIDTFFLELPDVGRPTQLLLAHDGKSLNIFKNRWHVNHVEVEVPNDPESPYFFPCDAWLSREAGCALSKMLEPTKLDANAEKGQYKVLERPIPRSRAAMCASCPLVPFQRFVAPMSKHAGMPKRGVTRYGGPIPRPPAVRLFSYGPLPPMLHCAHFFGVRGVETGSTRWADPSIP